MLLELRFLGGLSIQQNGVPLTALRSQKGQALLCYLVLTGKAHSRPALAGLLWPEVLESSARTSLRQVSRQLSQHLAPYLTVTRQSIGFNQDVPYWLDVAEFEAGVAARSDIGRLQAAVKLYRSDFLDGFYLFDVAYFDEWVLAQRARLRELALSALHRLVTHFTAQAEYETAIDYARQQLAIEPWREEGHRELMRLLALSGERSAALRQYETCRRILAEEVAVEPSAETETLYQAIRAGQGSGGAGEQGSKGKAFHPQTPTPPHNLPLQPTPFVGRESELAALGQYLTDATTRLITILGPGGMGKTRLALAAAERQLEATLATATGQAPRFANGIYFVALAPLTAAGQIVPTIAAAPSFSFREGRTLQEQLLDYLRQKHLLLVLDNFEHLLPDGARVLVDILQSAPNVQLLVTSRERLRLQEEHVYLLHGLEVPPDREITPSVAAATEAAGYPAVQLFWQSARRLQPAFEPEAHDLTVATRICRLVEGMPLAIELAAGWADTLSLTDIATEVQRGLDFLETDMRNLPERHRSMRAVFDVTWQRLNQVEQEVFAQLSVFRGGFTRQAAQAVTVPPASLQLLAALVSKSLLQYDRTRNRYQLHELLRQYAADKMAPDPVNEAAVRDRHAAYYCLALQQWETALKGTRQQVALAEIETDIENVQLAWEWAAAQGQLAQLDQAMEALFLFYWWHGRAQEGEAVCQLAVNEMAKEQWTATAFDSFIAHGLAQRLFARLLTWQSFFDSRLGHLELASQLLEKSQALLASTTLVEHDTRPERAWATQRAGDIAYDRADYEAAWQSYTRSLALYRAIDNQWRVADTLFSLGIVARDTGAYDDAKQLMTESLALCQVLDDPKGMSDALLQLGLVARYSGAYDEAKQLFVQNLELAQAQGNSQGIVGSLMELGYLALFQGEFEAGAHFLQQSATINREKGDREHLVMSLAALESAYCFSGELTQAHSAAEEAVMIGQETSAFALVYAIAMLAEANVHTGNYGVARTQAERALTLACKSGMKLWIAVAQDLLGWTALAGEKYAEAYLILQASVANYPVTWQREWQAWALAGLGRAVCGLGNRPKAQQHLVEALRLTIEIRAFIPLLVLLPVISLLLANGTGVSQQVRAIEVYALATGHPFVAKSRLLADIVGRHIAHVAATLPPEVVATAQRRGRALEWWSTAAALLAELEATIAAERGLMVEPG